MTNVMIVSLSFLFFAHLYQTIVAQRRTPYGKAGLALKSEVLSSNDKSLQ